MAQDAPFIAAHAKENSSDDMNLDNANVSFGNNDTDNNSNGVGEAEKSPYRDHCVVDLRKLQCRCKGL